MVNCSKCHKPPLFPCLYDHVPKPGPKICACECHKPKPVLLVDVSIAKIDQTADAAKLKPEVSIAKDDEVTKSAAQIFMEVKAEKTKTKMKLEAKLALLEKEVKLRHHLLEQTRTLLESKEALLRKKVRVSFNKCHKFWRGDVIAKHKSFVIEQVDAAKARLGLKRFNQFDISAMVDTINKLAPEGCYNSAKLPLPSTSTPRPQSKMYQLMPRLPRRLPPPWPSRTRPLSTPTPPILAESPSMLPARLRGEQCIVSHSDTIAEDLCYDHLTQLKHGDDEYFWDGYCYFYDEEAEIADADGDFICGYCDFGEAEVVYSYAEVEDGDFCDVDDYAEVNSAEDADEIYAAEEDYVEDYIDF